MIRKVPMDTESFHFHNANPKGKRTTDCVERAIATATGKTWEETLTGLTETALKYKLSPADPACYDKYLQSLGWVKQKQPRKENGKKYTGSEFCQLLKYWLMGRKTKADPVVAHLGGNHIVCFKDNKVWDTWDSTGGCVGNYWTKGN